MIFTFGMKPVSHSQRSHVEHSNNQVQAEASGQSSIASLLSNLAASSLAVLGLVLWAASSLAWTAEPAGKLTIKIASIAVTFSHTILGVLS